MRHWAYLLFALDLNITSWNKQLGEIYDLRSEWPWFVKMNSSSSSCVWMMLIHVIIRFRVCILLLLVIASYTVVGYSLWFSSPPVDFVIIRHNLLLISWLVATPTYFHHHYYCFNTRVSRCPHTGQFLLAVLSWWRHLNSLSAAADGDYDGDSGVFFITDETALFADISEYFGVRK